LSEEDERGFEVEQQMIERRAWHTLRDGGVSQMGGGTNHLEFEVGKQNVF
jgi:hypothetical protein